MHFDSSKDDRQNISLNRWKANKGIGAVDAIQRFGKTKIGIKAIKKVRAKFVNCNITVLVPSDAIRRIWKANMSDSNVSIYTMQEFYNNIKSKSENEYTLIIVDELHRFTTNHGQYIIRAIPFISRFRLGLTGNYPYNTQFIRDIFPVIDIITEEEALKNNWITEYEEYNLSLNLNKDEQQRYFKYSKYISETIEIFKGKSKYFDSKHKYVKDDLDYIYKLRSGLKAKGTYIHGSKLRDHLAQTMGWTPDIDISTKRGRQINDYWNPNAIYERVKTFKNLVDYRNELINNNDSKLKAVLDIIEYNDVPTIIFNNSIEFVNKLADALGSKAIPYHSKIKSRPMLDNNGDFIRYSTGKVKMYGAKRLKDLAVNGIKIGKYKYLITVKALDEGLDVPNIEQVIVTSGSINPIQQQQRTARAKTIDYDNMDKVAKIWNLYIDDFVDEFGVSHRSRDKSKLIVRQSNYKHEVLWVDSILDVSEAVK